MTDPKGDTFKMILNRTAVERLIGNDASVELILSDQAVRSFIGKHLTRLETIIRSQAESITKEMLEKTVTQLLGKVETLRDGKRYIPSDDMAKTITRMLEPLVDKRLREIVVENMQDIDAKIANVAEAYVVGEIDKRVKMMIDNAAKLARSTAEAGPPTLGGHLSMRARMDKQVAEAKAEARAEKAAQAAKSAASSQAVQFKDDKAQDKAARQMAYDWAENAPPDEATEAEAEAEAEAAAEVAIEAYMQATRRQPPGPIPPAVATRSWDEIAALAYSAYVAAQPDVTEPAKEFEDLPAGQQRGWQAAVRHAANCTSWRSDTDPSKWVGWRPPV